MKKLLFAMLCIVSALGMRAQTEWEDKTSLITNPSFEEDNVVSDATKNELNSAKVTGWTILPAATVSNAQAAVVNSSSTLKVLSGSDGATTGSKYFYVRQNWNKTDNFGIQQEISGDQPEGLYLLTVKIKTSSSTPASSKWYLSMQEEGKDAVIDERAGSASEWLSNGVLLYKASSLTKLTISAYMVAGASGNGQHYAMLLDDFQLKYISPDDLATISEENPLDMTGAIYNEGIYNANKEALPRGWQEYGRSGGNKNCTEGTGNTQLEGWAANGDNFSRDYYQTINNLPEGKYKVTAKCHDTNSRGAYLYIYSDGVRQQVTMPKDYGEITTPALSVSNSSVNIGIKLENKKGTWMTGDNFRLTYIGSELNAKKLELRNLKKNAKNNYLENETYNSVIGSERDALSTASDANASEETIEAYQAVINALNGALNNFVAQYKNYQLLSNEISKATVLGATTTEAENALADENRTSATLDAAVKALKVEEYNYVSTTYQYGVELGTWTTTGPTGSLSVQHYKGAGYEYLEQSSAAWGQNSWTIKYAQDVTLPAGNYVFKVAGRQADSDGVTLGLTVKNGETVIGTVSDFPRGDTGLGINTSGATDFTTGEGHEYVNNGNGRGWEWRYVKFTLTDDATVNVAVDAVATTSRMWVSFCDATVQTDNEANISLIAYNIALNNANVAINNGDYANVTGSEKNELQTAINADGNLDKTSKTAIDDAKDNLVAKTSAFTGAKGAYDAYVAAKAEVYPTLAYAATAKRTALDDVQSAADAISASDAETKTATILTAARQYYESHALAEGVTGAVNKTDLIADPNFVDVTVGDKIAGGWAFDQIGGTAQVIDAESLTDGLGNRNFKYFDYNNDNNNNQNIHQVISGLEPGHYMLTATGRGHANFNGNLQVYVAGKGNTYIPAIGNAGGVFGRGWNDASVEFDQTETGDVTIGAKTDNGKKYWWGVTRFRLVKLPTPAYTYSESTACTPENCGYANVTLERSFNSNWATFVVPFNIDNATLKAKFGDDVQVSEFSANDKTGVTFTPMAEPAITANKPVLMKTSTNDKSFTFEGVAVSAGTAAISENGVNFVGNYDGEITIPSDTYYVNSNTLKKSNGTQKLKGFRAYFTVEPESPVKAFFEDGINLDVTDAINALETADTKNALIYNLAGQRLQKMQRGINIVNGKKVLVK